MADPAATAARNGLIQTWDRIYALPIPATAAAVLACLARHGRWDSRDECRPSIATMCAWASASERQVQRLLRYLACPHLRHRGEPCWGDAACPHWGLLALERPARPGRPASWRLTLEPVRRQLDMPEVGRHVLDAAAIAEPRLCREQGCGEPHHARGLCNAHYKRLRRREAGVRAPRGRVFGSERPIRIA